MIASGNWSHDSHDPYKTQSSSFDHTARALLREIHQSRGFDPMGTCSGRCTRRTPRLIPQVWRVAITEKPMAVIDASASNSDESEERKRDPRFAAERNRQLTRPRSIAVDDALTLPTRRRPKPRAFGLEPLSSCTRAKESRPSRDGPRRSQAVPASPSLTLPLPLSRYPTNSVLRVAAAVRIRSLPPAPLPPCSFFRRVAAEIVGGKNAGVNPDIGAITRSRSIDSFLGVPSAIRWDGARWKGSHESGRRVGVALTMPMAVESKEGGKGLALLAARGSGGRLNGASRSRV